MIREHYANANVPMLPVVRGDRETARQIAIYTLALIVATLVPVAFGVFGLVYGVAAALLGALFALLAIQLWRDTSRRHSVRLFHYSLLYLALLFVAMAIDAQPSDVPRTRSPHPPDLMHDARSARAQSLARRNARFGLALAVLTLVLFGGTFGVGLAYLWLS